MKKIIFFLAFIFFFTAKSAFAADKIAPFQLENDTQYNEIMALEAEAREAIAFVYQEKTGNALPADTKIDLGKSLKIYVSDNLLSQNFDQQELSEVLAAAPILWYYEQEISGTNYLLEITKGSPVDESIEWTEEERSFLEAVAGNWYVSGKGYQDETSFKEKLQQVDDNLLNLGSSYLVTGLRLLQSPTLLIVENDQPKALYPLTETLILGESGDSFYSGPTTRSSKANPIIFEEGQYGAGVLDYQLVKEIAQATPVTDEVGSINTIDATVLLNTKSPAKKSIGILVIVVFAGLIIIWQIGKKFLQKSRVL